MLEEIGEALSYPRKLLWQYLPGLHDQSTGEALSGRDVVSNAFGLDRDSTLASVLGFGAETLGDPLPMLGGLAARGVGAAFRGLRGAGAAAGGLDGTLAGFARAAGGAAEEAGGAAATRSLAAAGEGASPLERSLGSLGPMSRKQRDMMLRSQTGQANEELAFMGGFPSADLQVQNLPAGLAKRAQTYEDYLGLLPETVEAHGLGHPTTQTLALNLDQLRTGLIKKAVNQDTMFEQAARLMTRNPETLSAQERAVLRGANKIAGTIQTPNPLGPAATGLDRLPNAAITRYIDSISPYQAYANPLSQSPLGSFERAYGSAPGPIKRPWEIPDINLDAFEAVRTHPLGGGQLPLGAGELPLPPVQQVPGYQATGLMNARRNVGVIKDFGPSLEGSPEAIYKSGYFHSDTPVAQAEKLAGQLDMAGLIPKQEGRLVGRVPENLQPSDILQLMDESAAAIGGRRARGIFNKMRDTNEGLAFLPPAATPDLIRHETLHALINRAANTGDYSGLGAVARMAARLQRAGGAEPGVTSGLASLMDEVAGNMAQARGVLPQLGQGAKFLMDPKTAYINQFAKESPLVAELYRRGPQIAGLGAGLAGGGAGIGGILALQAYNRDRGNQP